MFRFFKKVQSEVAPSNSLDVYAWLHERNALMPNAVMFDVGAHTGETSKRMLSVYPDAQVFAFEPFEDAYRQMQVDLGEDKRVKCFQLGMSSDAGEGHLFVNSFSQTNSLLRSQSVNTEIDHLTANNSRVSVELTTIDHFMQQQHLSIVDLLKIDVQGLSYEVLVGAGKALTEKKVRWVYAEVEFIEIYEGEKRFAEIELMMRNVGYRFVRFFNLNHISDGSLAWADALFAAEEVHQ